MSAVDTLRVALYGDPPSEGYKPSRAGVLAAFEEVVNSLGSLNLAGAVSIISETETALQANLTPAAGTAALVYNDPDPAKIDVWVKVGATGTGSWTNTNAFHNLIDSIAQPYVDDAQDAAAAAALTLAQTQAVAAGLPALTSVNFTETPFPATFHADASGRMLSYVMSDGAATPEQEQSAFSAIYGARARLRTNPYAVVVGTAADAALTTNRSPNSAYARIPFLFRCPSGRVLFFYQGRSGTSDYSVSKITMKTLDPPYDRTTWSAERVIIQQGDGYHIDNISCVYDDTTGHIEFIVGATPIGYNESTVTDPATNPAGAIKIYSFYTEDEGVTFKNRAGAAVADGSTITSLTYEDEARDTGSPYWNISPGSPGFKNGSTGELMIVGNCAGVQGTPGGDSLTVDASYTFRCFFFYFDRTAGKWKWRGKTPLGYAGNEATCIQGRDGFPVIEARSHRGPTTTAGLKDKFRVVHVASDVAGTQWVRNYFDPARPDQRVEGSVVRMAGGYASPGLSICVYANCREQLTKTGSDRSRLSLCITLDDARSFPWIKQMFAEPYTTDRDAYDAVMAGGSVTVARRTTGYSSMVQLSDDTILVVFEDLPWTPSGAQVPLVTVISEFRINLREVMTA